jgi:CheY-like chemotaxis protein
VDDNDKMKTMSGYFDLSESGMIPSQKLVKQEAERKAAMDEIKNHRRKAFSTLAGRGVLVCDSNPSDRKIIVQNLKKEGYIVFTAQNQKECEAILSSIPIHAIIADVEFPGVELIGRANGETLKIVIAGNANLAEIALAGVEKVGCLTEAVEAVLAHR